MKGFGLIAVATLASLCGVSTLSGLPIGGTTTEWTFDSSIPRVTHLTASPGETSVSLFYAIPDGVSGYHPMTCSSTSGFPNSPDERSQGVKSVTVGQTVYTTVFMVTPAPMTIPGGTARRKYGTGVKVSARTSRITTVPSPPTQLTPSGALSTKGAQRPIFTWQANGQPTTWFHLWITRNGQKYLSTWLQSPGWRPEDPMPAGEYSWWVMGANRVGYGLWSGGASFTIPSLAPSKPTALTPSANTRLYAQSSQTFTWQPLDDAEWYEIYIHRNNGFHTDQWTRETSYTPSPKLGAGRYEWWLRAWNSYGLGKWSSSRKFIYLLPDASEVTGPNSGDLKGVTRPEFRARTAAEASWYCYYITKGGQFFTQQWVPAASTSWTPATDLPVGHYQAWVQTWNPYGFGLWSPGVAFTRAPSIVGIWDDKRYLSGTEISRLTFQWDGVHENNGRGYVYQKMSYGTREFLFSWSRHGNEIHIVYDHIGHYLGTPTYIIELTARTLTINTPDGSHEGITAYYVRH